MWMCKSVEGGVEDTGDRIRGKDRIKYYTILGPAGVKSGEYENIVGTSMVIFVRFVVFVFLCDSFRFLLISGCGDFHSYGVKPSGGPIWETTVRQELLVMCQEQKKRESLKEKKK